MYQNPNANLRPISQDLAGFWDMLQLSIENISLKFDELHQLKANNWKPLSPPEIQVQKLHCQYQIHLISNFVLERFTNPYASWLRTCCSFTVFSCSSPWGPRSLRLCHSCPGEKDAPSCAKEAPEGPPPFPGSGPLAGELRAPAPGGSQAPAGRQTCRVGSAELCYRERRQYRDLYPRSSDQTMRHTDACTHTHARYTVPHTLKHWMVGLGC